MSHFLIQTCAASALTYLGIINGSLSVISSVFDDYSNNLIYLSIIAVSLELEDII